MYDNRVGHQSRVQIDQVVYQLLEKIFTVGRILKTIFWIFYFWKQMEAMYIAKGEGFDTVL